MAIANILKKIRDRIRVKLFEECNTAVEQITIIVDFINSIAYVVGLELIKSWRFNNRTLFTLCLLIIIAWLLCYSYYILFPSLVLIELIGGISILAAATAKYENILRNHKKYMSLINFVLKIYNENVSGVREQILFDAGKTIVRHCKYVGFGMMFGLVVFGLYPIYDTLFNGNLTLASPLLVPFVDQETVEGYCILMFVTMFPVGIAVFGGYAFSCLFITLVDVYDGLVSLIEDDIKVFDSMWEKQDQSMIQNRRKLVFRNMIMQFMDLARFNAYMNPLFSFTATVQIISSYIGTVSLLVGYLANDYFAGIGGSVYFITELMIFCYIGRLFQDTNERILVIIYSSKWYTYEAKYQKDFVFALNIFQNIKPILIANLYPLNFETGLEVINNIYTLLMVMLNILE